MTIKRFYKQAEIAPDEAGPGVFRVTLDGRALRTPARAALRLPTAALALAIAEEWQAQGDKVDPATMPMMRLASTALDRVAPRRGDVQAELVRYGGSDLVCYRAEAPRELAERQSAAYEPLLAWASRRLGARLVPTAGVMPIPQPQAALEALDAHLAGLDDLRLGAAHTLTAATGSLVVALALLQGELTAEAAADAAELDEAFQAERWGEDPESAKRRWGIRAEIAEVHRFLRLLEG